MPRAPVSDASQSMSWLDLRRFAGGGLRGHHLRTALSLLGVAIGVAAVIILTALGEGAKRYVVEQFAIPTEGNISAPVSAEQWIKLVNSPDNDPALDPATAPAG